MKKFVLAAVAVMLFALAGNTPAADIATGSVTVNATVNAKCGSITAGSLSLTIDPSMGGEIDSSGTSTTVQCTKSQVFNVSVSSAGGGGVASTSGTLSGKLKAAGLNDIPYTLYFTKSFTGGGLGTATPTTIIAAAGSSGGTSGVVVSATDAQAAQAGAYSDTITLTVSY
ncbi:MAG: spore coat protein U domain-containing protein [Smithellaceae bacterium]